MRKKYHNCRWSSVCPPACPTNSSSHFCPKNSVWRHQESLTHSSGCVDRNHRDGQPSWPRLQWTYPRKQPLSPRVTESRSNLFTDDDYVMMSFSRFSITTHYKRSVGLDWQGDTWKTPCRHHHDVYRYVSLGVAAQLSVWISWRFVFIPVVRRSVWMTNGRELTNRRCGVNAASLCERGYSQPPQVASRHANN